MKLTTLAAGLLAAGALAACDSPLDTDPRSQIPADQALDTPGELRVAVNGLYDAYQDNGIDFNRNVLVFPELYADNLTFSDTYETDQEVADRDLTSVNTGITGIWRGAYIGVNRANTVLAALPGVEELTAAEAAQYRGEALFVRAHMYFILAKFFGGVPLVETPTTGIPTQEAAQLPRATEAQVYALVERDLREARALLGDAPFAGRAGADAAAALLARVNLYARDWAQAHAYADSVIAGGGYSLVEDYAANWRNKNGPEAIFEIQYTVNDPSSFAGWFSPLGRWSFGPTNSLRTTYLDADDNGDTTGVVGHDRERSNAIIGGDAKSGFYINKYFRLESGDDNYIVLRLAEMYLIRSEAAARLGELEQAVADIDVIRARAGLAPLAATVDTRAEVLDANLRERRRELALEGHRFFDIRRMADASPLAQARVGTLYGDEYRLLFPIPQSELDTNERLTQNPGY